MLTVSGVYPGTGAISTSPCLSLPSLVAQGAAQSAKNNEAAADNDPSYENTYPDPAYDLSSIGLTIGWMALS